MRLNSINGIQEELRKAEVEEALYNIAIGDKNKTEKDIDLHTQIAEDLKKIQTAINCVVEEYKNYVFTTISDIVTSCLTYLNLGVKYRFALKTDTLRGTPVLRCVLFKGKEQFDLEQDTGDGVIEAIAFAIRIALWMMTSKNTDPIFILDEPFSHVDTGKIPKIMAFVKAISDKYKIQFIIITHSNLIAEEADNIIQL